MKTNLSQKILILCMMICSVFLIAPSPVGTVRKTLESDSSGNVINTPVTLSNQWSMVPVASSANHLIAYKDLTNYVGAATNTIAAPSLTGNLNISRFNSGTGASGTTFWRGDGTWGVAGTGNAVTNVSGTQIFTGTNAFAHATVGGMLSGSNTTRYATMWDYNVNAAYYHSSAIFDNSGWDYGLIIDRGNGSTAGLAGVDTDTGTRLWYIVMGGIDMSIVNSVNNGLMTFTTSGNGNIKFQPDTGEILLGSLGTLLKDSPATSFTLIAPAIVPGTAFITNVTATSFVAGSPVMVGRSVLDASIAIRAMCTNSGIATVQVVNEQLVGNVTPSSTVVQLRCINP